MSEKSAYIKFPKIHLYNNVRCVSTQMIPQQHDTLNCYKV